MKEDLKNQSYKNQDHKKSFLTQTNNTLNNTLQYSISDNTCDM